MLPLLEGVGQFLLVGYGTEDEIGMAPLDATVGDSTGISRVSRLHGEMCPEQVFADDYVNLSHDFSSMIKIQASLLDAVPVSSYPGGHLGASHMTDDQMAELLLEFDNGTLHRDQFACIVWEDGFDPSQIARVYFRIHRLDPWKVVFFLLFFFLWFIFLLKTIS